jgi:hypothetical protein
MISNKNENKNDFLDINNDNDNISHKNKRNNFFPGLDEKSKMLMTGMSRIHL